MAKITAAMVKQLREMTDSPMMECKKALVEADGDIEKAVDVLRTMGIAKAVKRAGRETNEGTVAAYVSEDGKVGSLVELTCETDFVGTNPKFTGFAARPRPRRRRERPGRRGCPQGLRHGPRHRRLRAHRDDPQHRREHAHRPLLASRRRVRHLRRATSTWAASSACICEFTFAKPETAENDEFKSFAHDIAMQVAAAGPVAARREDVPADVLEHEKEHLPAQAAESGKPEAIQERIAEGRLEKFYKENVLTEQEFIKDGSVTISELLKKVSKACDDDMKVVAFDRFVFGE
jgi:elongation factor Ts